MSVIPGGAGSHHAGRHKWETIRYALDDTGRTVRLCVILLTMSLACCTPFLIMTLARR
jgi:hypothetical protein